MRIPGMPRYTGLVSPAIVSAAILLVLSLFLAPERVAGGEPPVYAVINAKIVTVAGQTIESGSVVVRNGIIESVGTGVPVPADARIIDAKGMTVYPGLIDALSDAGLEEPAAGPAQSTATPPSLSADEKQGLTPYLQAADILNPASRRIEAARAAGITTALVIPRRGFFQGQSSLINLGGNRVGEMVVKTPVFMHIGFGDRRGMGAGYPGSLMGVLAFVKQTLLDAQNYEAAWNTYSTNPGMPRPEYSRALQSLVPAVKQQIAVVLPGDTPAQIRRALDLAAGYKLRMILAGGAESGKIAPVLRELNVPVLLSVRFPERDRDVDPSSEEELSVLRRRVEAPSHAVALANAGVRFAFQSDAMSNPGDLIRNVAKTVEAGLDRTAALRSLTLTPAEIFGVADKLGSIEKGKCANLVLATGDIFDVRTRIRVVFVDGRMFEIQESQPAKQGPAEPAGASNAAGTWVLRVNSPQGPLEVTLKLQQFGTDITGTLTSPFGTVDISEGTISGTELRFKANINPSGTGNFIVSFTAILEGAALKGSADAGIMGRMEFTGSKSPNDR